MTSFRGNTGAASILREAMLGEGYPRQALESLRQALARVSRLGLVTAPSPVGSLAALGEEAGFASLHVKRDDLLPALGGGNKPRKLDYLLAEPRFADSPRWVSVGGIGSGQLVALARAAALLDREFVAHSFEQPLDAWGRQNLGHTASGPVQFVVHGSRLSLAVRHPQLLCCERWRDMPVIHPGASCAKGMLGMVAAVLELFDQIAQRAVPRPDALFVALGSGGSAVGLAVGAFLCDLPTRIVAVRTVERWLVTRRRMLSLARALLRELGVDAPPSLALARLQVDHSQCGRGYGYPTRLGVAAQARGAAVDVPLEGTYTAKAFAALWESRARLAGKHVLFWHTARHPSEPPTGWESRLPPALRRRLAEGEPVNRKRRRFILGGGAVVAAFATSHRLFGGYPELTTWRGAVLSPREASIVAAAAEALVPLEPASAVKPLAVAANVDVYLAQLPPDIVAQVHQLLWVVEQGTPLVPAWSRLSHLSVPERADALRTVAQRSALLALAVRSLRDLCALGYYQEPASWRALGYEGPLAPVAGRADPDYEALRAAPGARPRASEANQG